MSNKTNDQEKMINLLFPDRMFVLESFKEYSEEDFIEEFTYKLLNKVKQNKEEDKMDFSSLFHEIFEKGLNSLKTLQKEVNYEIVKITQETEESEKLHKDKLENLGEDLETISEKFKQLEISVNKVGNTIVQIGNNLELKDIQKKRAIEARKLIKYFQDFNRFTPEEFEKEVFLPIDSIDRKNNKQLIYSIFTKKNKSRAALKVQQLRIIIKDLNNSTSCEKVIFF
jgi:hypothetical protein